MFKKQPRERQEELWIRSDELNLPAETPFWSKFQGFLDSIDFDRHAREACAPFYTPNGPGQPGVDPVVYFKMLLIAFFENLPSERAIEARCADSLGIWNFLGIALTDRVPDHSTLSRIRHRLPLEVFDTVYGIVFPRLRELKLIRGKALGMDTSVIDANAAMKSLRNRMTREKYRAYVKRLAKREGVDITDEAAVSRFDRNRKGRKTSNDEWFNPHDPDAKVGPTKHGGTRMIYKPEHLVDMETGAILDATVLPGDRGDSTDVTDRLMDAEMRAAEKLGTEEMDLPIESLTADKGYHSVAELEKLSEIDIIPNIPDPCDRRNLGKLSQATRQLVEWSRAVVKSVVGKELQRARGMHIERSFAHVLDAGGMRRATLRGRVNIEKRYKIAALGYNISLAMRTLFGIGTPKQWAATAV
jgi:transposase